MQNPTQRVANLIISLLLVGGFGILLGRWLGQELWHNSREGALVGLWAVALFPAALALAIILHEVGHVLAARLAGCRPRLFAAGPLIIRRGTRRIRVELHWGGLVPGGMVAATPPEAGSIVRPVAILVTGGPLTNLLLSLVSAGIYRSMEPAGIPSGRLFVAVFGIASLIVGLISLNPYRPGMASDGLRLLRLWPGGTAAERDAALFTIFGLIYAGIRPADWPQRLLEQATALIDGTADEATGQILAYYHALDLGRPGSAGNHLNRALELVTVQSHSLRPGYYLEAAYSAAMLENNKEKANDYLARAGWGAAIEPYRRLRCEAAVLMAHGQTVRAMEQADLALALLARKEKNGTDHLEESLLRDLRTRGGRVLKAQ